MHLSTIGLVVMLAVVLLVGPRPAAAQQRDTLPTIGILSLGSPPTVSSAPTCDVPFRQGLHDLGYVEGQTIRFEYRYAESKIEPLPALAAALVQHTPAILFTWAAPGGLATQQATTTIPILAGTGDLISSGIITVLKAAVPQLTRVAAIAHPANQVWNRHLRDTIPAVERTLRGGAPTPRPPHPRRGRGSLRRPSHAPGRRALRD